MGNITITFTDTPDFIRIQGTCDNLNQEDVLIMLGILRKQILHKNIMEDLTRENGGYFQEDIDKKK